LLKHASCETLAADLDAKSIAAPAIAVSASKNRSLKSNRAALVDQAGHGGRDEREREREREN